MRWLLKKFASSHSIFMKKDQNHLLFSPFFYENLVFGTWISRKDISKGQKPLLRVSSNWRSNSEEKNVNMKNLGFFTFERHTLPPPLPPLPPSWLLLRNNIYPFPLHKKENWCFKIYMVLLLLVSDYKIHREYIE